MTHPHHRFDPKHVHKLDNPERKTWFPMEEVVQVLSIGLDMRIVDIGAGSGYFALPFAERSGAKGRVWAVDISPEMLEVLAQRTNPDHAPISMVQAEASATGLPDETADLVFLANVWHEVDDAVAVARESYRLTKPSGRIAVLDWRRDLAGPPGPPQDHRVDLGDVKSQLEEVGWEQVVSKPLGPYCYLVIGRRI